ncbi:hypothetical protein [Candidatus Ichthyocystis hellenicum]|uniref:hypothetical protein n=1 Tax=Candidatus Ichthyocystis hellenicum TaxID=1561003 RepID=UPI000B80E3ED|nr:hypothetical protein [Candidatus Ichthyocystis hellenicum]
MDDILVERVRRVDFIPISPMLPNVGDEEDGRGNRGGGGYQGEGEGNRRSNTNTPVEFYLYTHDRNRVERDFSPAFVTRRRRFRRLIRCV